MFDLHFFSDEKRNGFLREEKDEEGHCEERKGNFEGVEQRHHASFLAFISLKPQLPQDSLFSCFARNTPGPHLGQKRVLRLKLSPEAVYKLDLEVFFSLTSFLAAGLSAINHHSPFFHTIIILSRAQGVSLPWLLRLSSLRLSLHASFACTWVPFSSFLRPNHIF